MSKVLAHQGCTRSAVSDAFGVRGVYFHGSVPAQAQPRISGATITVEPQFDDMWGSPVYVESIECYDCNLTIKDMDGGIESYKLEYALINYPSDYGVEVIDIA